MKKCKFCGEEFTPRSNRQQYCDRVHKRICPVCGKEYVEDNHENLSRPPVACSYECRVKKTQNTSLAKYGVKAPGNSKEARDKAKKTMLSKYGGEYTLSSSLKAKVNATNLLKYGDINSNSSQSRFYKLKTKYDLLPSPELDLQLYTADIRRIEFEDKKYITLSEVVDEKHITICEFYKWAHNKLHGVLCEVKHMRSVVSVYNLIICFMKMYEIDSVYIMCSVGDDLIGLCKRLSLQPVSYFKSHLIFKILQG